MPTLFVSGCSYSSYTGVRKVWGEHLAESLGYQYQHCAIGCGNNDRTWRIFTRKIISGEITPADLIVIQYTDIHRREFAASEIFYEPLTPDSDGDDLTQYCAVPWIHKTATPWGDMYTTNYKPGSYQWMGESCEKLHYHYEHTAVDENWAFEHFFTQHAMFKILCDKYNIRLLILHTQYDGGLIPRRQFFNDWDNTHTVDDAPILFPNGRTSSERSEYDLGFGPNHADQWDTTHLSALGHQVLGVGIYQHIVKNNI